MTYMDFRVRIPELLVLAVFPAAFFLSEGSSYAMPVCLGANFVIVPYALYSIASRAKDWEKHSPAVVIEMLVYISVFLLTFLTTLLLVRLPHLMYFPLLLVALGVFMAAFVIMLKRKKIIFIPVIFLFVDMGIAAYALYTRFSRDALV